MALRHVASYLARAKRDPYPSHPVSHAHEAPAQAFHRAYTVPRASRTSPPVPCVSKRQESVLQRLRDGPIPCPQRTADPVPWTPRCTFVPTPVVTIVVGWGLGICGPTAIPVAVPGGSSTVPR